MTKIRHEQPGGARLTCAISTPAPTQNPASCESRRPDAFRQSWARIDSQIQSLERLSPRSLAALAYEAIPTGSPPSPLRSQTLTCTFRIPESCQVFQHHLDSGSRWLSCPSVVKPNAATPTRFIQQEVPLRCYNCNQYGHTQLKCQANPKYGKSASQHRTSNCSGTHLDKCAACHGAHCVTDPRCSIFIKERIRMNEQQRKRGLSRPQW